MAIRIIEDRRKVTNIGSSGNHEADLEHPFDFMLLNKCRGVRDFIITLFGLDEDSPGFWLPGSCCGYHS